MCFPLSGSCLHCCRRCALGLDHSNHCDAMLRTIFHQMVCKSQEVRFTHTHAHTDAIEDALVLTGGQILWIRTHHTNGRLYSHNYTNASLRLYEMSKSYFLSGFSPPFGMVPINSGPGGKEETSPVRSFMAFPTIAQEYNGVFTMSLYNYPPPLTPPDPPHHQGD